MVLVLVALINLPAIHSTWQRWRVATAGIETTATVVSTEVMREGYWLSFRYPEGIDEERSAWPAEVEKNTWDRARESGEVEVRHLEGRPSAYEVEGQVRHWAGLLTTLIADVVLLVILLMVWRFGGRRRPEPLRLSALGDVERCPPGGLLEPLEDDLYLVRGEVVALDDGEVWLDVGDQDVLVILDGHANAVGYQQPAQVRGRLLP